MNDLDISFKEYIDAFRQMETTDKRKEIIYSINEIASVIDELAAKHQIQLSYLKVNDVPDLKEGYINEDAYFEALLIYIENAKSLLGQYLLKVENK